jgi:hypothetical protein
VDPCLGSPAGGARGRGCRTRLPAGRQGGRHGAAACSCALLSGQSCTPLGHPIGGVRGDEASTGVYSRSPIPCGCPKLGAQSLTCRCAAVAAAWHDPPVALRLIYLMLTNARFDSKEIEILVLRRWVPETPFTAANAGPDSQGVVHARRCARAASTPRCTNPSLMQAEAKRALPDVPDLVLAYPRSCPGFSRLRNLEHRPSRPRRRTASSFVGCVGPPITRPRHANGAVLRFGQFVGWRSRDTMPRRNPYAPNAGCARCSRGRHRRSHPAGGPGAIAGRNLDEVAAHWAQVRPTVLLLGRRDTDGHLQPSVSGGKAP